jgi:hypothetical protein
VISNSLSARSAIGEIQPMLFAPRSNARMRYPINAAALGVMIE